MKKMEAYKYLQDNGAGFLANVVLVRHSDPARKLKALAAIVASGRSVGLAPFDIDTLLIDGRIALWSELGVND